MYACGVPGGPGNSAPQPGHGVSTSWFIDRYSAAFCAPASPDTVPVGALAFLRVLLDAGFWLIASCCLPAAAEASEHQLLASQYPDGRSLSPCGILRRFFSSQS